MWRTRTCPAHMVLGLGLLLASEGAARAAAPEHEVDPELAAAIAADAADAAPPGPAPGDSTRAAGAVRIPRQRMNPGLSLIFDGSFAWHREREHLKQGGHTNDETGFALQGLELAASASVDPYFRFDLAFQISHLHLEEAYLTTLALPWNLQARAGYFNAAFGRFNPRHLHVWSFANPPLAHSRFLAEEHFSSTGAELSVLLPLPWSVVLTAEVFGTSSEAGLRSASFGRLEQTEAGRIGGPEDLLYVARGESFHELSADWSLLLGTSGAWGQSPFAPEDRTTLYGVDLYLKWRPISSGGGARALALTVEALLRDTQIPSDSVRDAGAYAQLDAQLALRWVASVRAGWVELLEAAPPSTAPFAGDSRRLSTALTFIPSHFSKLRLQYDLGRLEGLERVQHAVFLQVEGSVGEHRPHRL